MKQERSQPKGWPGKIGVLDELQIISCKRLTTVRRFAWLCFLLGLPRVPSTVDLCLQCLQASLLSRHNISLTEVSFVASHNTHIPLLRRNNEDMTRWGCFEECRIFRQSETSLAITESGNNPARIPAPAVDDREQQSMIPDVFFHKVLQDMHQRMDSLATDIGTLNVELNKSRQASKHPSSWSQTKKSSSCRSKAVKK
jgi:hypothetical protein